MAEVGGKIVYMDPRLDEGALMTKGTEILRIDPTEYELIKKKALSAIRNFNARLDELRRRESNLAKTLEVEQKSLDLSQRSFPGARGFWKKAI